MFVGTRFLEKDMLSRLQIFLSSHRDIMPNYNKIYLVYLTAFILPFTFYFHSGDCWYIFILFLVLFLEGLTTGVWHSSVK